MTPVLQIISILEAKMAGLKNICKAHGGMKVTGRDGVTIRYDAEGNAMAPKAPTKVLKGIPIGKQHELVDGKIAGKPDHAKLSRPAQYQKANKKRYVSKRAIGGQRP